MSVPTGPTRAVGASIEVRSVAKSFGGTRVLSAVDLGVRGAAITALLGPSGCGKTTLLRIIAGLERPDAGQVAIGGRAVAGSGIWVPPERRNVGMVFQDWALFPHLTVRANVAFGLPRGERRGPRVDAVLDMVGLEGHADRLPGTLSGGQQQRVALARALAPEPRVLLLDEPFSNLDSSLRTQVRRDVRSLLRDVAVTAVFVTHDQEEAFFLGDDVAVLDRGSIAQHGTPSELYDRPGSPWIAGFVGEANLLPAVADGHDAATPIGPVMLRCPLDGPIDVLLRPEHLTIDAAPDGTTTGGDGQVLEVEYFGHDCAYAVRIGDVVVRVRADVPRRFDIGDPVSVRPVATALEAWPRAGGGDPPTRC